MTSHGGGWYSAHVGTVLLKEEIETVSSNGTPQSGGKSATTSFNDLVSVYVCWSVPRSRKSTNRTEELSTGHCYNIACASP